MKQDKAAIRKAMRERRRALPAGTVEEAGRAACALAARWAEFRRTGTLLAYAATDNEVPTGPLIEEAWRQGKRVFLPATGSDGITFRCHRPGTVLVPGRFGIPEATGEPFEPEADGEVMIVTPLLAWDLRGGRLGRGGGYYDRCLRRLTGRAVVAGFGYEFQECALVPMDDRDELLDFVVSERRIVRCGADVRSARNRKDRSDGLLRDSHQPVRRHHSRLGT